MSEREELASVVVLRPLGGPIGCGAATAGLLRNGGSWVGVSSFPPRSRAHYLTVDIPAGVRYSYRTVANPQENPTVAPISEAVRLAVLNCYCELQHVEVDVADRGFNGGIPFDSILGVEMAANLEIALSVVMSEKRLAKTSVYSSLAAFAAMVQQCMEETPK